MGWRRSLTCLTLALFVFAPQAGGATDDAARARRDMDGITKRLNDLDAWFGAATRQQRDLQKDMRTTDQAIATTNQAVRVIEAELTRTHTELDRLDQEMQQLTAQRDEQAQLIAQHLAAAYRLSGEDFLKLLLNQEDPQRFDRMLRYHRYFSAARTEAITAYQQTMVAIDANTAQTRTHEEELGEQEKKLDAQRKELLAQRKERQQLLASLGDEMKGKSQERSRLTEDRVRLEKLIAELNRRALAGSTTFARNKGKLPWPTQGKLAHRFGQQRADGLLTWQGVFIAAPEGTPVTAVASGRVAFSDWLRGFGLMTIIDHGSGYMSLYAHSDVLYKRVGETVTSGETVAATGSSGGQTDSGLYFEIRHNGAPIDPMGWLSRR
jgi:septal ring factor EnvC (AmiA/AmiB activator)